MTRSAWGAAIAQLTRDVAQTDPVVVALMITVVASIALVVGWRAWRSLFQARLIEDTPVSKARSAPQGYVELEGIARAMDGAPTIAPLTGLPCCWYRYLVEEQTTTHDRNGEHRRWEVVDRGECTDTFWLEDNTGRVALDPEGAEISPKHKDAWNSNSGFSRSPALPDTVATFMRTFFLTRDSVNPHRFTEWRINSGDPLYALGLLKNVSSYTSAPTINEDVSQLLREWKKNQPALKQQFDLNKDGQIDEREWMLVRAQARREVMKTRAQHAEKSIEGINLLGPTRDSARPFIVSAYPQQQLIQRYRWAAMFYGLGFFAAGSIGIWLAHARFG